MAPRTPKNRRCPTRARCYSVTVLHKLDDRHPGRDHSPQALPRFHGAVQVQKDTPTAEFFASLERPCNAIFDTLSFKGQYEVKTRMNTHTELPRVYSG